MSFLFKVYRLAEKVFPTFRHPVNVRKFNIIKLRFPFAFEEYFHDPEDFIPERFNAEHGGTKVFKEKGVFIPFGDGPRICLGMRFAQIQLKTAVLEIVRNFKITVDPTMKANNELEIDPDELLMNMKTGGLWLNFEALNKTH